jgi:hypothetical protein
VILGSLFGCLDCPNGFLRGVGVETLQESGPSFRNGRKLRPISLRASFFQTENGFFNWLFVLQTDRRLPAFFAIKHEFRSFCAKVEILFSATVVIVLKRNGGNIFSLSFFLSFSLSSSAVNF